MKTFQSLEFFLITDPQAIQQRKSIVREIYAQLIEPGLSSIVLLGLRGIGKSTLAALVFNYAESQRRAAKGSFAADRAARILIQPKPRF